MTVPRNNLSGTSELMYDFWRILGQLYGKRLLKQSSQCKTERENRNEIPKPTISHVIKKRLESRVRTAEFFV